MNISIQNHINFFNRRNVRNVLDTTGHTYFRWWHFYNIYVNYNIKVIHDEKNVERKVYEVNVTDNIPYSCVYFAKGYSIGKVYETGNNFEDTIDVNNDMNISSY